MGSRLISFKGDVWRGRTNLATADRGDRRMVRILNGYVSSDGSEIRMMPGWTTLVDLTAENNPNGGFARYVIDSMRPVLLEPSPNQFYTEAYDGTTSLRQTLMARAKPLNFEWFTQVAGTLVIGGISRFRECPVLTSGGSIAAASGTIQRVKTVTLGGDVRFTIDLGITIAGKSDTDAGGPGMNGVSVGNTVYIEGIVVADALFQAAIDAGVNGKVSVVTATSGTEIEIRTDIGSFNGGSFVNVSAGEIHLVRPNRTDIYPTPSGVDPVSDDPNTRIDDWPALTTWQVRPILNLTQSQSTEHECYPAWVANRRRDYADEASSYNEGVLVGSNRGISRREQKELPYRMVPESAGDRVVIAVPGYNCLFQVPMMVPFNPDNWPLTPAVDGIGIRWFGNDQYDIPRSLGIPKGRLIDSPFTPAAASPSITHETEDVTHLLTPIVASPQFSFPPGTYGLCITYSDSVTGEEGEPSEPVEFTIPNNDYAYTINLTYVHPGYLMPECLADKINVYMTDVNGEAFGFYKSLDLRHITGSLDYLGYALEQAAGFSPRFMSSKYGFTSGHSPDQPTLGREWNTLHLPLARQADSEIGNSIDFTRPPAPLGMPRGASVARVIRGTLVTGGHIGTEGPTNGIYPGYGSIIFGGQNSSSYPDGDVLIIRQHTRTDLVNPADGTITDGFGVASRVLPDSMQGIEGLSDTLIPNNMGKAFQVDRVLNRESSMRTTDGTAMNKLSEERVSVVRPLIDLDFRESPSATDSPDYLITNGRFFWRMFKGHVQIGEPGRPHLVAKAGGLGIKIIDYNKDDDIVAIGQLAGNAVICSRLETYFLSWQTSPLGSEPTLVSGSHGCIAPNSMVEFDGGIAWLSERGPVAIGAGLQFIGHDIEQDFVGESRLYQTDSDGMMRHAWGCHDPARSIVMWGLIANAAIECPDGKGGTVGWFEANDTQRSRAPCDTVLIWSYRTNSFSTWQPPFGMEIVWVESINAAGAADPTQGVSRIAFMTSDGRILALDDIFNDCNSTVLTTTATTTATSSTTLVVADSFATDGVLNNGPAGRKGGTFLAREQQIVALFDEDNNILWTTSVSAADPNSKTFTLAQAKSWKKGQTIKVGVRQMVIETTAIGAEFLLNGSVTHLQARYTLHGTGRAAMKAELLTSDIYTTNSPNTIAMTNGIYEDAGVTSVGDRHSRRRAFAGKVESPEVACRLTVVADAQVRISDLSLEVV